MAIATLDAALAGMQFPQPITKGATPSMVAGRPQSLWYLPGAPGVGLTPANTAGGVALSSSSALVAGQIPHYDPGSGNSYLAQFGAKATLPGTLMLCDRLMHVGGTSGGSAISPTTTTAQTINTGTLPSRDRAGSANGDGIMWGLEIVVATGVGTGATPTLSYTNQAAASGKASTLIDTYAASSTIGAFYRFNLTAGDTGIQSVQTLTLNATMTSGTLALVAYRVLAELPLIAAFVGDSIDALTSGFPQLFPGTVPFLLFVPNATTAVSVSGVYSETQG